MIMKRKYLLLTVCIICLVGCRNQSETELELSEITSTQIEFLEQTEKESQIQSVENQTMELKDLMDMVGMKDEDTANLLGGGEENWTDDKSFYIGRKYQIDLYGDIYKVFTTCGKDKIVESVSLWIVDGEQQVTDMEVPEWEKRITDIMGVQPIRDTGISEGGSRNSRWMANGMSASINQMEDILTINFQYVIGELK